jgi:hypothetical protein
MLSFETIAQSDIDNWILKNINQISNEDYPVLSPQPIASINDCAFTDLKKLDIEACIIDSKDHYLLNKSY